MWGKIKQNIIQIASVLIAIFSLVFNLGTKSGNVTKDIEILHDRVDKTKAKVEDHNKDIINLKIDTARLDERIRKS